MTLSVDAQSRLPWDDTDRDDSSAVIDPTGRYRYRLTRRWGTGPTVCFIMLNPSTADQTQDDATIRRCLGFARDWNFHRLEVVNLFAWRATQPHELWESPQPVGPDNDRYICETVADSHQVILAWGAVPKARARITEVLQLIRPAHSYTLGWTAEGYPRHPLYASGKSIRIPIPDQYMDHHP